LPFGMSSHTTCVFFDCETGGLLTTHPIIELAVVAVDMSSWEEIEIFDEKIVTDPTKCDPIALEVNHYSPEKWKDAIPELEFIVKLGAFLNKYKNVRRMSKRGSPYYTTRVSGHNITGFDLERVSILFKKHHKFLAMDYSGALDTLRLAAWIFFLRPDLEAPRSYRLTDLAEYFKVKFEGEAHTALADTRVTVQVAKGLLDILTRKAWA